MNERIKELADQLGEPSTWGAERPVGPGFAGSRWSGWSDIQQEIRGYNTPLYDTAQLEKFAELVVRECRIIMSENFHECRTASLMDKKIKEHFGIEDK